MEQLYLPTLHTFAMENEFTGSHGAFRFRIVPQVTKLNRKEVDMENSAIVAEFWHGELCYEFSTMEGSATFPMSEQGREDLRNWLTEHI